MFLVAKPRLPAMGFGTQKNGVRARVPRCPSCPSNETSFRQTCSPRTAWAPTAVDARWVAFYTLSRREKDLMRKLEATAIPFYAPLIRRRLHSAGGRTRFSQVPLFPGYVFSLVDDDQRRKALGTNTIARWLPIADESSLVADLRAIRRLIETEQPLTPEARLESGQPVRVRSGGSAGSRGWS